MQQGTSGFTHALRKRFLLTWWAMGSLLIPIAFFLHSLSPLLSDNYLYDAWLSWREKPPSSDILIVAIDEPSLQALGRWPWPRSVHAQLIDQLQASGAKSIVLDILLVEPSQEDALLAESLRGHGEVYLPMALLAEQQTAAGLKSILLPPRQLLQSAKAVGHTNIATDVDGVVRRVLLSTSRNGQDWPQLMMLLARTNQVEQLTQPVRIPFRGGAGHYPTVSYNDVLMGYVPASLLADRTVLVGMTALGLGDRYNVSLLSAGLMPGVEIHAHLLDAIHNETLIREMDSWLSTVLSGIPILILMFLAWWLRFRYLLLIVLLLCCSVLAFSLVALSFQWWWPPSASLMALGIASIVIVWQSQAMLLSWFKKEIGFLYKEPSILPYNEHRPLLREGGNLYQQSQALEFSLSRLVEGRRFILEAMHSLPLPIFILNKSGKVLLANNKAKDFCEQVKHHVIEHIDELSNILIFEESQKFASLWPPAPTGQAIRTVWGCMDELGRTYRLELGSLSTSVNSISGGWLLWLVDMTSEVDAEEQRASMLRFLSHDMKVPPTRALAQIDAQREPEFELPQEEFYRALEQSLNKGLEMINGFIDLTKVKTFNFSKTFVLFEDVVMEALDQVSPLAWSKKVVLVSHLGSEDGAPVLGDKSYLLRAIVNLIENSIKYSGANGRVDITVSADEQWVVLNVIDNGVGIPLESIERIFESFQRNDTDNISVGHGIGLAMVKAVADSHGGSVNCKSERGKGSQFTLMLPAFQAE